MLRIITIVGMVIALSACSSSSGGGGGSKVSTLDSTADGAAAGGAAATAGLQAVTLSSSLKDGLDQGTLSPHYQQAKLRLAATLGAKAREMSKAAEFAPVSNTYPVYCDSGTGSEELTYDTDTGEFSYTYTYNECLNYYSLDGTGPYYVDDGVETLTVTTSNETTLVMTMSSDLSYMEYDAAGNLEYKEITKGLTMTASFNDTSTTFNVTIDGKEEYNDYVSAYYETNTYTKLSMSGAATDDLWTTATMTMNGKEKIEISDSGEEWSETISMTNMNMTTTSDGTFSLDGKMSLSSTPASCSDGTYTYETIVPMTVGYYGDVIAGEIKINGAYTITYLADGSVSVTDSEGSEITYTADEMANICSLV